MAFETITIIPEGVASDKMYSQERDAYLQGKSDGEQELPRDPSVHYDNNDRHFKKYVSLYNMGYSSTVEVE